MVGRRDFSNISVASLREQSAMLTLRKVRKDGHVYVEIRQDGKRLIFFCVLCLAPCYSDTTLFEHLKGHHHRDRYATAEVTLLGRMPWPFSDGVFFFCDRSLCCKNGPLLISNGDDRNGGGMDLVIPGVLRDDGKCNLEVKLIGYGEIGARVCENEKCCEGIKRIWCAWLGDRSCEDVPMLPNHEFGVVTFAYDYNLGRKPVLSDSVLLCGSGSCLDIDSVEGKSKRRRKSFSDNEDVNESLSEQCESSVEDFQGSDSPSLELVSAYQIQHSKSMKRRIRKEMRQQQRLAAERMCDICNIKLLPGKDVATLLNMKTGKLACSSRNTTGAFHLFHTSCLLHWILLCEFEIRTNCSTKQPARKTRAKRKGKKNDARMRVIPKQISSIFCPECQGTGITVEDDQLEKPSFLLSEMFKYKIKSKDAQRAWMKAPELLQNCSIGLHFPGQSEESIREKVVGLKLLHFYRADV